MNNIDYNKNEKYMNKTEVKMLNLNQLIKSLLLSIILTLGVNIVCFANNVNISLTQTQKLENLSVQNQQGLNNLVKNIGNIAENITTIIKEFEKINSIKLKNAFIVGILKNFNGDISFAELQQLNSLGNVFNNKTPIEILEFTAELISNKSNNEATKIEIKGIKNQINNKFKINVITQTDSINAMKKHPIIQKMINASKQNPEKLKGLLNNIIDKTFSASSSVKTYFNNIVNEIGNLL